MFDDVWVVLITGALLYDTSHASFQYLQAGGYLWLLWHRNLFSRNTIYMIIVVLFSPGWRCVSTMCDCYGVLYVIIFFSLGCSHEYIVE